jgi:hypothetical protein
MTPQEWMASQPLYQRLVAEHEERDSVKLRAGKRVIYNDKQYDVVKVYTRKKVRYVDLKHVISEHVLTMVPTEEVEVVP